MIPRRRVQPPAERVVRALLTPERLAGAARLLGHALGIPGMQRMLARRGVDARQLQSAVRETGNPDTMRQLMEEVGEHHSRAPHPRAAPQRRVYAPEQSGGARRSVAHAPGAPGPAQAHPVGHTERGKRGGVYTVNAQGKKIYKKKR